MHVQADTLLAINWVPLKRKALSVVKNVILFLKHIFEVTCNFWKKNRTKNDGVKTSWIVKEKPGRNGTFRIAAAHVDFSTNSDKKWYWVTKK